jgi:hypothetical protein
MAINGKFEFFVPKRRRPNKDCKLFLISLLFFACIQITFCFNEALMYKIATTSFLLFVDVDEC